VEWNYLPRDIDALKNIGVCDDSLQYKMHMENLKTASRKPTTGGS